MRSILLKLISLGLLAGLLLVLAPALRPLVDQAFPPPVAHKTKPVLPPPGIKHLAQVEDLVFAMTNRARQARGLAPFLQDEELRGVAQAYSDAMLVRQFFDHTDPDGVSFDKRISGQYPHWVYAMGENIWTAFGYPPGAAPKLAQEIVTDWLNSPDHRENILSPDFTHLGVGISARHRTILATQEFVGKPRSFSFRKLFTFGQRAESPS
jgi:uncharacterized protein YkwD